MRLRPAVALVLCVMAVAQTPKIRNTPAQPKAYALSTWDTDSCRAKGRFQDRGYCSSSVMDQIVADGKAAIPTLISQITDTRLVARPVYDFWPRIRTGELAYFILADLFVDETWQKATMPQLFRVDPCDDPSWVCWDRFRKKHGLKQLQVAWLKFWMANRDNIYWDEKSRCFRLGAKSNTGIKAATSSH